MKTVSNRHECTGMCIRIKKPKHYMCSFDEDVKCRGCECFFEPHDCPRQSGGRLICPCCSRLCALSTTRKSITDSNSGCYY